MVRTPSGLKPGSTARNKAKLFINSPAPTSNTSAKAISATTSALRRRCRAKLAVEARLLSFSASATSAFAALHAGINPKTTPVSNDNSSENVSTYPSMPIAVSRGRLAGFNAVRRSTPHIARTTPSAPPSAASNTLSTISWRTSLKRPAPSAARITISRWRDAARASSKLAKFVQAIRSTKTTKGGARYQPATPEAASSRGGGPCSPQDIAPRAFDRLWPSRLELHPDSRLVAVANRCAENEPLEIGQQPDWQREPTPTGQAVRAASRS